jgi:hypothetical protein
MASESASMVPDSRSMASQWALSKWTEALIVAGVLIHERSAWRTCHVVADVADVQSMMSSCGRVTLSVVCARVLSSASVYLCLTCLVLLAYLSRRRCVHDLCLYFCLYGSVCSYLWLRLCLYVACL